MTREGLTGVQLRHVSDFQAIHTGSQQAITERLPHSRLGHPAPVPAWLGWGGIEDAQSASDSHDLLPRSITCQILGGAPSTRFTQP